ncbi:MAG: hypothetical protein ACHRXM_03315 [Isosphaerales bacterium]
MRTQKLSLIKLGDTNPFATAFCVHSSRRFVTTEYRLHEAVAVGKRLDLIVDPDLMQFLSLHPRAPGPVYNVSVADYHTDIVGSRSRDLAV